MRIMTVIKFVVVVGGGGVTGAFSFVLFFVCSFFFPEASMHWFA